MKKNEIYEGKVSRIIFPDKGIVDIDGNEALVKNAIPGQRVRFIISKKRHSRYEGKILEVLEKSPLENDDILCDIFPLCGGCAYLNVDYNALFGIKYEQVKSLISPVLCDAGKMSKEETDRIFLGIEKSPEITGYRNKMEYSFGDALKDGPLTLGFHKKGSRYDVLTATNCALVHDDINQIVSRVLDYCVKKKLSYYHKATHIGLLRHLLIRRSSSSGEIIAAIVTSTQEEHNFSELVKSLLSVRIEGELVGILHVKNDSASDTVKAESVEILYGRDFFYENVLGLKFKVTPFSFFQTNTKAAELLYSIARDMIGDIKDASVFDLYSGTGTIAQVLAPFCEKVTGIEIVEEAVKAAKENAILNSLDNCEFYAGDVLKVLDEINEVPDFLVIDPPREGVHPKALRKIIKYNAKRIVYISCKPTSLKKDLEVFLTGGYKAEQIKCVDMFPYTVHVETVVLMSRVSNEPRLDGDK